MGSRSLARGIVRDEGGVRSIQLLTHDINVYDLHPPTTPFRDHCRSEHHNWRYVVFDLESSKIEIIPKHILRGTNNRAVAFRDCIYLKRSARRGPLSDVGSSLRMLRTRLQNVSPRRSRLSAPGICQRIRRETKRWAGSPTVAGGLCR